MMGTPAHAAPILSTTRSLANLPAGGDTVIEKLETYLGEDGNVGAAAPIRHICVSGMVNGKMGGPDRPN
jgi:hypothetical protein